VSGKLLVTQLLARAETCPTFFHKFELGTTDKNLCVQPVLALLEEDGLRWYHIPTRWLRTPSECDRAEWESWAEENVALTGQLADAFCSKEGS
jgi:hypothetical protein